MLSTPLGNIVVSINNIEVEYTFLKKKTLSVGNLGLPIFDVDSRYHIEIDVSSYQKPMTLTCQFDEHRLFKGSINTGERLALKT